MINDSTIEDGATYWCILKDQKIKAVVDNLIAEYNSAKKEAKKDSTLAEAGKDKAIKSGWKVFTTLMKKAAKSKAVEKGVALGIGGAAVGGGAYLAGTGVGAGASNAGKGVGDGSFRAKNGGQSVDDLNNDPNKQSILDKYGVTLKDVGIAVGIGAALYALWKSKNPLKAIGDRFSQVSNWFKRGLVIAKCNFTSGGDEYEAVFDLGTCKWSLLRANGLSGKVDDDDCQSYFESKHFKKFSNECFKIMKAYFSNEAFAMVASQIKKVKIDNNVKKFFTEACSKKRQLLNGLSSGVYNT